MIKRAVALWRMLFWGEPFVIAKEPTIDFDPDLDFSNGVKFLAGYYPSEPDTRFQVRTYL